jgi:hypothetical protein
VVITADGAFAFRARLGSAMLMVTAELAALQHHIAPTTLATASVLVRQ